VGGKGVRAPFFPLIWAGWVGFALVEKTQDQGKDWWEEKGTARSVCPAPKTKIITSQTKISPHRQLVSCLGPPQGGFSLGMPIVKKEGLWGSLLGNPRRGCFSLDSSGTHLLFCFFLCFFQNGAQGKTIKSPFPGKGETRTIKGGERHRGKSPHPLPPSNKNKNGMQ